MSADEVTKIIEDEIGSDWSHTNAHGIDLRSCILSPKRVLFFDPLNNSRSFDLWLVLEECPQTCGGYKIVFDEERKKFGLGMKEENDLEVFLGLYGTFMETLDAM